MVALGGDRVIVVKGALLKAGLRNEFSRVYDGRVRWGVKGGNIVPPKALDALMEVMCDESSRMPFSRMVTFHRAPALTPSAFWKKRMEAVQ